MVQSKSYIKILSYVTVTCLVFLMVTVGDAGADAYILSRSSISSGGGISNSAVYKVNGVLGEFASGLSQSQSYSLRGGFGLILAHSPTIPLPPPTPHLSPFPQLPEGHISSPARLSVKYLNVQPQQAQPNQPVTIYANIANSGDETGSYTVTLKINGQIEEIRTGKVGGHAAVPLKFEVLRNKPGTYNVDINGQQTSFIIVGNSGNKSGPTKDWALIGFFLCAIGVIVVLALLIRKQFADS